MGRGSGRPLGIWGHRQSMVDSSGSPPQRRMLQCFRYGCWCHQEGITGVMPPGERTADKGPDYTHPKPIVYGVPRWTASGSGVLNRGLRGLLRSTGLGGHRPIPPLRLIPPWSQPRDPRPATVLIQIKAQYIGSSKIMNTTYSVREDFSRAYHSLKARHAADPHP